MRAAVVDRYGPPESVRVVELPDPEPGPGEVLVRVVAAPVTSGDSRMRAARFPHGFGVPARLALGLRGPRRRVPGPVFSGVVEAVGPKVTGLAAGDEVCGMSGVRLGGHAELVAARVKKLVRKPAGVSHDDAAGVLFGGTTALWFLRDKARVGPGTSVLVNGASGAVGTNAVQLARHLGGIVTGVTSTANVALVQKLGAAHVVDRTVEDVLRTDRRYDVVVDTVGTFPVDAARRLLTPDGRLLLLVASLADTVLPRRKVVSGTNPERKEDFELLLRMVEQGELVVVHDEAFALDDVAAAHRRVDTGRKVGNVLLHPLRVRGVRPGGPAT